jgi:hypothetical protein
VLNALLDVFDAMLPAMHFSAKLYSLVSDLLGVSARRILKAPADGETNPAALAVLADHRLRATPAQLVDALGACTELHPVYRRLLTLALEELHLIEQQIAQLGQEFQLVLALSLIETLIFYLPAAFTPKC